MLICSFHFVVSNKIENIKKSKYLCVVKETRARSVDCLILCGEDPSTENVNKLEILKTENDLIEKYLAQGVIA